MAGPARPEGLRAGGRPAPRPDRHRASSCAGSGCRTRRCWPVSSASAARRSARRSGCSTAQSLVRTAKGAGGGTYVTMPSVDHVSQFLNSALNLLAAAEHVSLDELLEAREALEVPAARLAALRRSDGARVEQLRATIPPDPGDLAPTEQFVYNADFHTSVIAASGNAFLMMAAQPLFTILQTSLARSSLGSRFHRGINEQHRAIAAAIANRDARRGREGDALAPRVPAPALRAHVAVRDARRRPGVKLGLPGLRAARRRARPIPASSGPWPSWPRRPDTTRSGPATTSRSTTRSSTSPSR